MRIVLCQLLIRNGMNTKNLAIYDPKLYFLTAKHYKCTYQDMIDGRPPVKKSQIWRRI